MALCNFSTFLRASLAALRASLSTLGAFLWAALARSNRLLASSALCLAAFNFSVTEVVLSCGSFAGAFFAFIYVTSFACWGGGYTSQYSLVAHVEPIRALNARRTLAVGIKTKKGAGKKGPDTFS
jgi:hypothetical protein